MQHRLADALNHSERLFDRVEGQGQDHELGVRPNQRGERPAQCRRGGVDICSRRNAKDGLGAVALTCPVEAHHLVIGQGVSALGPLPAVVQVVADQTLGVSQDGGGHAPNSGAIEAMNRHQKAIETIERNASALAQIVEDILDVSRIISGKLRLNV